MAANEDYGETFGEKSRCIYGTYIVNSPNGEGKKPRNHVGCHEIECENDEIRILIGNQTAVCKGGVEFVVVQGYSGRMYCPDPKIVCSKPSCRNNCYGMGKCVDGKCECGDDEECMQEILDSDFSGKLLISLLLSYLI